MKLYSNDGKPLTPKAKEKAQKLTLEAAKELVQALKTTRDVHNTFARGWRISEQMYRENVYHEIMVSDYGTWVDDGWDGAGYIEDNDFMVLTDESRSAIDATVNKVAKRHKKLTFSWSISEKCLIVFDVSMATPTPPTM